ncbi:MAG: S8 family serine peptidase [Acidimicrobiia bacterium]
MGATAPPVMAEPERALEATLLVGFGDASTTLAHRVATEHGARLEEEVGGTGIFVVSTDVRRLAEVRRSLAADPRVAFAETNHERRASAVPKDVFYSSAQAAYLETIRLPEAWDLETGADDVVVAVVDSGVDLEHPDLEGRLLPGRDFVNDDDSPDDDFGHGTEVATIAAAATDNRTGMAGVAWQGKVLPVKVLDHQGRGNDADIAAGIIWAADHGADVINLSFGAPQPSFTLTQAVKHARSRDAVVVSAAGNGQTSSPDFPAALDGVMAVSATDGQGHFAWFSNYGPTVDVAAPDGRPGGHLRALPADAGNVLCRPHRGRRGHAGAGPLPG